MATAATEQTNSQRKSAVIVVLVVVQVLLVLSYLSLPAAQAFASEPSKAEITQYLSQEDSEEPGEPGYAVYRLDYQDSIDAQTNQSDHQGTVIIPDYEAPLANPQLDILSTGTGGSFLNTIIVMVSILAMGIMLCMLLVRKTSDYRVITVRTIAVTFGLVTVVIWSLFDKLQLPTVLLNDSSTLIIAFFAIFVITSIVSYSYEKHINKKRASRRKKQLSKISTNA